MSLMDIRFAFPRRLRVAILAAPLALAAGACSGPGFVDEPTGYAEESNLVKSVMQGLGAIDPAEEKIRYNQRAPLVMPSDDSVAALPPPVAEGSTPQEQLQNWPTDPETPVQQVELTDSDERAGRLLPGNSQTRSIPIASRDRKMNVKEITEHHENSPRMSAAEMRAAHSKVQDIKSATTAIQSSGPPQRRYLTDPPTRFTTPAASASTELPDERREAPKIDKCKQTNIDARTYARCQVQNN